VVKLKINSPVVRDALLDGCTQVIRFEKQHPNEPTDPVSSFSQQRCRRRIAAATALDEQLMAGYAVVDVPVEIADAVASNVAEVIAEEMDALVCDTYDKRPRGLILRRAAGLMEALVALEGGVQREVMPFDRFTLTRR
jgi:hypothetical protein